jgi:hypothetical protein
VVVNPGAIQTRFRPTDREFDNSQPCPVLLFFDSLKFHRKSYVSDKVREWLNSEWKRLDRDRQDLPKTPFTEDSMPLHCPKGESAAESKHCFNSWTSSLLFISPPLSALQQENGWDCGVFICRYGYSLYLLRTAIFSFREFDAEEPQSDLDMSLLEKSTHFRFTLKDIARIREEFKILIERLHTMYNKWNENKHNLANEDIIASPTMLLCPSPEKTAVDSPLEIFKAKTCLTSEKLQLCASSECSATDANVSGDKENCNAKVPEGSSSDKDGSNRLAIELLRKVKLEDESVDENVVQEMTSLMDFEGRSNSIGSQDSEGSKDCFGSLNDQGIMKNGNTNINTPLQDVDLKIDSSSLLLSLPSAKVAGCPDGSEKPVEGSFRKEENQRIIPFNILKVNTKFEDKLNETSYVGKKVKRESMEGQPLQLTNAECGSELTCTLRLSGKEMGAILNSSKDIKNSSTKTTKRWMESCDSNHVLSENYSSPSHSEDADSIVLNEDWGRNHINSIKQHSSRRTNAVSLTSRRVVDADSV